MSLSYFVNDYFEGGEDLQLPLPTDDYTPRKPSLDQILPSLLLEEEVNPISNTTLESSKSKVNSSESSSPSEKKTKKRRQNSKTQAQGRQRGHWCLEQNKKYHWFLQIHNGHFLNKQMRRMDKIFKTMERFVITREAEQCRSHHQKMQKKYGSFSNILKALRNMHYGSGDGGAVIEDLKANGIESDQQIISWGALESGVSERVQQLESERQTVNEMQEVSGTVDSFIDPLQEFQWQNNQMLQALIS